MKIKRDCTLIIVRLVCFGQRSKSSFLTIDAVNNYMLSRQATPEGLEHFFLENVCTQKQINDKATRLNHWI